MLAPETIVHNRYRVVRLIGAGGMGAVYEAIDGRLGNRVALKQTTVRGDDLDRAFEREARLLAELRHQALPKVIDFFSDAEGQFLVMEYIPGTDLAALLAERGRAFDLADVLEWGDQLLRALDYLHRHNLPVIHRDIKPQNLKLTGENEIVLLDFGLAKGDSLAQSQTEGRSLRAYTLRYAPLEQIQGSGTDARSDLYSLAATLYHLISATPPVDALARAVALAKGQSDPLRPAHELHKQVPLAVSRVLAQGLALQPEERPQSARAMRDAWQAARRLVADESTRVMSAGEQPTIIQPTPRVAVPSAPVSPPAQPPSRRSSSWIWLLGLLVVAVVAGSVAWSMARATSIVSTPTSVAQGDVVPSATLAPSITIVPSSLAPSATPVSSATSASTETAQSTATIPPSVTATPTARPSATATFQLVITLTPVAAFTPGHQIVVRENAAPVIWSEPIGGEPVLERPRLYPGALVEVVQQDAGAIQVRTPEGVVGWVKEAPDSVFSIDLSFVGQRERFPIGSSAQVVWSTGIPLRQDHNSQAGQVVLMQTGQQMVVQEMLGDWLRVTLNDGSTGWARWYYDQSTYIDLLGE